MASRSTNRNVLVSTILGHWNGLKRLPLLLHQAGCKVTLFAPKGCPAANSRYITTNVIASEHPVEHMTALRAYAEAHPEIDWLIYGDEPTLVAAYESRDGEAWPGRHFPVELNDTNWNAIISKASFCKAAMKHGVPIPESRVCDTAEAVCAAAEVIGYPVMIKTARGFAGNGVRKASDPQQLSVILAEFSHRYPIVVQDFIAGRIGSTQLMFDHGRPLFWMASSEPMVHPEPFGPSCVRRIAIYPEMEAIVTAVGKMTGFTGLAGMDWICRDEDGAVKVLEFNPRPTPVTHLVKMAGIDPAKSIAAMLEGRQVIQPQQPTISPRDSEIYMFPQHLRRCVDRREWRGLLKWLPFVSKHDIPWNEPYLILRESFKLMRKGLKKLIFRDAKPAIAVPVTPGIKQVAPLRAALIGISLTLEACAIGLLSAFSPLA